MGDSSNQLIIGVDGGGTGCRVAVGTAQDGVLAVRSGGRANATTDREQAVANIMDAVLAATIEAGRDPADLGMAIAHLGLAGVMTQADADKVAGALPYVRCTVTDDRLIVVSGALDGADGFVVAIGTGTIIAASRAREMRYVGGWGFQVSDQASGAWLGRAALDRTLQCHDGVLEHSAMTREILAQFDNDPNGIVTFAATARPGDYGAFAPKVVAAAQAGQDIAVALMREGADYIARGLSALGFQEGDTLCLTGGVGQHYAPFLDPHLTRHMVPPKRSAVEGAFELARLAAE